MTVILMFAMFAIFLTIDYLRNRKEMPHTAEGEGVARLSPRMLVAGFVAGFELPDNRRYHPGHTWALQESPTLVRVGIDDFGARLAGRLDELVLPKRGQWLRQGQKFATIIRDGQRTDLVSPIEGEVTNINEALTANTSLANIDPYGEGWFISVLAPDLQISFRNLLNGSLARKWMADAASRLQARVPALAGAVAQDGGPAVHDLTAHMPTEKWGEITREFFLT
jgi:glycine cleavage system H lipoate-binding protein